MANNFTAATKKIQDLMTLYAKLDGLPNRAQWHFDPKYQNGESCAFVFAHQNADSEKRYESLSALANVLSSAGIKASMIAQNGVIADVIIRPEYADLARKMFARYQSDNRGVAKNNIALLEQEWLRQCQK